VDLDYHAIAPEIILAITIIGVLVVDLLPVPKYYTGAVGLLGLFASAIPLLTLGVLSDEGTRAMLGGSYVVDDYALVLKGLFLLTGFVSLLMSVGYLENERFYQGEFYFLLLASVGGAVVMASSRDLLTMFIGLELVSGPAFLMAGWRKGDVRSNEAALKFFITGVLSATILVFGMSLVYGATGAITFEGIRAATVASNLVDEPIFILGVLFVLVGFGFKVSAVPFHFWAPDTYQGAPTPVAAYLSVGSKAAGFVGLLSVCYLAFGQARELWGPALWILAVLSMTVGNLTALRQTNIVRLLGYSSVAQGGFILVPFAMAASLDSVGLSDAFFATVTYLLVYAFMNLGAFAVVIAGARKVGSGEIADWAGFNTYAPGLAGLMAAFFLSLAGIPPLAGWFAKLVMFRAVLFDFGNAWAVVLAAIAAVNAVVAFFYYAKVVKSVWMDPVPETVAVDDSRESAPVPSLVLALGITVVAVLVIGVFPQLLAFFGEATEALLAAP
jgi:NADH-quinone oxidoreductase subunit N